jgi:hypothetical protein
MITKAKKSHEKLSASWRPWHIGSMAWSKSKSVRTRETDNITFSPRPKIWNLGSHWSNPGVQKATEAQGPRVGEKSVPTPGERKLLFLCHFCFIWAPNWLAAACLHRGQIPDSVHWFICQSPSQISPETVLSQISNYPLIHAPKFMPPINHHNQWQL